MEWISVKDRLPECEQDVLMYFDTGNMAVGFWHDGDETITFWCAYSDDGWYTDCDCEPLYWMEIPEPPEVRHAKWVSSEQYNGNPECSACFYVTDEKTNYCPHCGCKMDKEDKDT